MFTLLCMDEKTPPDEVDCWLHTWWLSYLRLCRLVRNIATVVRLRLRLRRHVARPIRHEHRLAENRARHPALGGSPAI